jgi:hypothetical protein
VVHLDVTARVAHDGKNNIPRQFQRSVRRKSHRHYGRLYGYFDLLPHLLASPDRIDPANRQMKVCTIQRTHSYMAITA